MPAAEPDPEPGQNIEIAELNGYVASIWMELPTALPGDDGQIVLFARQVLAKQEMDPLCDVNVSRS